MLPKVKIVEVFEELSPQDNGYWEVPDGVYKVEFALVAGGLMEVVEEEPLKLLIVGLRAVEEDQVIVVLLFYIILKMDNMNRNDIIKRTRFVF